MQRFPSKVQVSCKSLNAGNGGAQCWVRHSSRSDLHKCLTPWLFFSHKRTRHLLHIWRYELKSGNEIFVSSAAERYSFIRRMGIAFAPCKEQKAPIKHVLPCTSMCALMHKCSSTPRMHTLTHAHTLHTRKSKLGCTTKRRACGPPS